MLPESRRREWRCALYVFEEMKLLRARRVPVDGHAVESDGARARDPNSTAYAVEILAAEIGRVRIVPSTNCCRPPSTNICRVGRWRIRLRAVLECIKQQVRRGGSHQAPC